MFASTLNSLSTTAPFTPSAAKCGAVHRRRVQPSTTALLPQFRRQMEGGVSLFIPIAHIAKIQKIVQCFCLHMCDVLYLYIFLSRNMVYFETTISKNTP